MEIKSANDCLSYLNNTESNSETLNCIFSLANKINRDVYCIGIDKNVIDKFFIFKIEAKLTNTLASSDGFYSGFNHGADADQVVILHHNLNLKNILKNLLNNIMKSGEIFENQIKTLTSINTTDEETRREICR